MARRKTPEKPKASDENHNPVTPSTDSNLKSSEHSPSVDPTLTADTEQVSRYLAASEDVLASDNGYVVVGKIGRSYGLDGMVFVQSFTDPKENLFHYPSLWLGNKDPICFSRHQTHAKHLVAQVDGTSDCDGAKRLTNKLIYLHTHHLPKLAEGQYYWHELTGLAVVSTTGRQFGKVEYIYDGGQFPIMVIKRADNTRKQEILIPYEPSVVQSVDLDAKEIEVEWDVDV